MTSSKKKITDHPILIPSLPQRRPCHEWSVQYLSGVLGDKKLTCRVWKKSPNQVLETECTHMEVILKQFYNWLYRKKLEPQNPLGIYDRSDYAGYIDYKYMKDVFDTCPHKLLEVQWADFGLPDFDGKDSTIWIGSEGSNTTGHQDSYGFNLVTQIEGRKMWVLFPPRDTNNLYPTRLPYEESSVFTQVNLGFPNLKKYPNIKSTHPLVVVLHPGQTLYVPHHWWHYVESLDPSISINVWIPHSKDTDSHLAESVTRCLATSFINEVNANSENPLHSNWLNPTETLYSAHDNIQFLKCAIENVLIKLSSNTDKLDCTDFTDVITTESWDVSDEKRTSVIKKEGTDYLSDFSKWLKAFEVYQASPNPCKSYCFVCENKFEGCILSCNAMEENASEIVDFKRTESVNLRQEENMTNIIISNSDDAVINDKFIHWKRKIGYDGENSCEKRQKGTCEPEVVLPTTCTEKEAKSYVLALTSPLEFDQYIKLMELKTAQKEIPGLHSSHPKISDYSAAAFSSSSSVKSVCCSCTGKKSSNFKIVSPSSQLVSQLSKNLVPAMDTFSGEYGVSQFSVDSLEVKSEIPNKETLSFSSTSSSSSPLSLPQSLITHQMASSNTAMPDGSQSKSNYPSSDKDELSPLIVEKMSPSDEKATNLLVPNSERSPLRGAAPPIVPHEMVDEDNSKVSQTNCAKRTVISERVSGLSQTEVKKIFFESILHPSVVKQISSLIKFKSSHLLLLEKKEDL